MTLRVQNKICLSALLCLFVLVASPVFAHATEFTPEQAKEYMAKTKDLTILDVRNPNEFVTGHYPNALNIPVAELEQRIAEVPTDKPVLIHCAKGIRAKRAYDLMKTKHPKQEEIFFIKGRPLF